MNLYLKQLPFVLGALLISAVSPAQDLSHTGKRPFSVRDSIEMTTFSDPYTRTPGATAKEAPDHSGFLVVTTRGILRTNELDSSLWFYSAADLAKSLKGVRSRLPSPKLLLQHRGVPEAHQTNSYGALITNVQWSEDSQSVYALVEMKGGVHHFVRIGVTDATFEDLTPNIKNEIHSASVSKETVAYLQEDPSPHVPDAKGTTGEITRTGQTIFHILFPERYPDPKPVPHHWTLTLDKTRRLRHPASAIHRVPFPSAAVSTFSPTLSPNGNYVVTVIPSATVPLAWNAYRAAESMYRFDQIPVDADRTGQSAEWPWQFAIVDSSTGHVRSLFDSPVAWSAGYWNDTTQASWSASGDRLLLTNTFLPIPDGMNPVANSIQPCAIAVYAMGDGKYDCVAQQHASASPEYLSHVQFDREGKRIESIWRTADGTLTKDYILKGTDWIEESSLANTAGSGMKLTIHQDLTEPPSLWVEHGNAKRVLWNPNPQLAETILSPGRVYQWTDDSGHLWTGGLLIPSSKMPDGGYPLVIQTHGFSNRHEFMADGSYTTGFAAQPLACSGIAVLQMEDRSDKQQRSPSSEGGDAVRGILSAIDSLRAGGIIDDSKVGIIGFSRTHWYVERALEAAPTRFKAAVLIDGVDQSYITDLLFAPEWTTYAHDHEASIGSRPFGEGLPKWIEEAAGFNADKIHAAVRLEAITTSSVLGEWETYSVLRQLNRPVDLVEIPDGQHILQKPRNRYMSQQGTVDWFRFWLQGYERSDNQDSEQYKRWEHMREQQKTAKGADIGSN